MGGLLGRVVLSLVVAIAVGLGCLLLGIVLTLLTVPIAVTIGGFITQWAWVIGLLAGLWFFFTGGGTNFNWPGRGPSA